MLKSPNYFYILFFFASTFMSQDIWGGDSEDLPERALSLSSNGLSSEESIILESPLKKARLDLLDFSGCNPAALQDSDDDEDDCIQAYPLIEIIDIGKLTKEDENVILSHLPKSFDQEATFVKLSNISGAYIYLSQNSIEKLDYLNQYFCCRKASQDFFKFLLSSNKGFCQEHSELVKDFNWLTLANDVANFRCIIGEKKFPAFPAGEPVVFSSDQVSTYGCFYKKVELTFGFFGSMLNHYFDRILDDEKMCILISNYWQSVQNKDEALGLFCEEYNQRYINEEGKKKRNIPENKERNIELYKRCLSHDVRIFCLNFLNPGLA